MRTVGYLLEIPATLLPVPLSGQSLLDPFPFTRLQVEGMFLHFLDNVLLLDFPLEPAEGVFQGFALLKSDFCQTKNTSLLAKIHTSTRNRQGTDIIGA